jgi:hypothetical protein
VNEAQKPGNAMWELIQRHRYRAEGTPVDLSQYHNHGTPLGTGPAPGPMPGQAAIGFPAPGSVVTLAALDRQWSPLVALRITATVYVDTGAALLQTLIEGPGAFRFGINQNALDAQYEGAGANHIRSDAAYAPDGAFHAVPANRWVTLGFEHDGYARMRLTIDGDIVAETAVTSGIPPVQGSVTIGNDAARLHRWQGAIDELQAWRLYPKAIEEEFLCRPCARHAAQCWEARFRSVRAWAEANPAQYTALADTVTATMRPLLSALYQLPPADQASVRALLKEHRELWCAGRIEGAAMRSVLDRWIGVLRAHGLDGLLTAGQSEIDAVRARLQVKDLDVACDAKAEAYLRHLEQALEPR